MITTTGSKSNAHLPPAVMTLIASLDYDCMKNICETRQVSNRTNLKGLLLCVALHPNLINGQIRRLRAAQMVIDDEADSLEDGLCRLGHYVLRDHVVNNEQGHENKRKKSLGNRKMLLKIDEETYNLITHMPAVNTRVGGQRSIHLGHCIALFLHNLVCDPTNEFFESFGESVRKSCGEQGTLASPIRLHLGNMRVDSVFRRLVPRQASHTYEETGACSLNFILCLEKLEELMQKFGDRDVCTNHMCPGKFEVTHAKGVVKVRRVCTSTGSKDCFEDKALHYWLSSTEYELTDEMKEELRMIEKQQSNEEDKEEDGEEDEGEVVPRQQEDEKEFNTMLMDMFMEEHNGAGNGALSNAGGPGASNNGGNAGEKKQKKKAFRIPRLTTTMMSVVTSILCGHNYAMYERKMTLDSMEYASKEEFMNASKLLRPVIDKVYNNMRKESWEAVGDEIKCGGDATHDSCRGCEHCLYAILEQKTHLPLGIHLLSKSQTDITVSKKLEGKAAKISFDQFFADLESHKKKCKTLCTDDNHDVVSNIEEVLENNRKRARPCEFYEDTQVKKDLWHKSKKITVDAIKESKEYKGLESRINKLLKHSCINEIPELRKELDALIKFQNDLPTIVNGMKDWIEKQIKEYDEAGENDLKKLLERWQQIVGRYSSYETKVPGANNPLPEGSPITVVSTAISRHFNEKTAKYYDDPDSETCYTESYNSFIHTRVPKRIRLSHRKYMEQVKIHTSDFAYRRLIEARKNGDLLDTRAVHFTPMKYGALNAILKEANLPFYRIDHRIIKDEGFFRREVSIKKTLGYEGTEDEAGAQ
eukprot:Nk52_evm86s2192 gene=Nk52_evmTU86s2192